MGYVDWRLCDMYHDNLPSTTELGHGASLDCLVIIFRNDYISIFFNFAAKNFINIRVMKLNTEKKLSLVLNKCTYPLI